MLYLILFIEGSDWVTIFVLQIAYLKVRPHYLFLWICLLLQKVILWVLVSCFVFTRENCENECLTKISTGMPICIWISCSAIVWWFNYDLLHVSILLNVLWWQHHDWWFHNSFNKLIFIMKRQVTTGVI